MLREIEIVLYSSAENGYFVWRRGLVNCVLYAPLGGIEGQGRVGRSSSFIFICFYYSYTNIQWMHNNLCFSSSPHGRLSMIVNVGRHDVLFVYISYNQRGFGWRRWLQITNDDNMQQYTSASPVTTTPSCQIEGIISAEGHVAFREQSSSLHRCNLATRHRGPSIFVVLLPNPLLPPYTFSNRQRRR